MGKTPGEVKGKRGAARTTRQTPDTADDMALGVDSNRVADVDDAAATDIDDADVVAAEIRSDIEQTRAEMSETIDALQEKLDPSRIAQQVKEEIRERAGEAYESAKESVKQSVRDATIGRVERIVDNVSDYFSHGTDRAGGAVRDTRPSFVQTMRDNPFATALIGVGVGMLWMNRRSQSYAPRYDTRRGVYGGDRYVVGHQDFNASRSGDEYYAGRGYYSGSGYYSGRGEESGLADKAANVAEAAREKAGDVADAARDAAHRATEAVSSAASRVADTTREQAEYVANEARYRADQAGDMFQRALEDNPMAVGIAAVALGALFGMALPETRVENEYMGQARDHLVQNAKSMAQDAVQKVQEVTHKVSENLKDDAGQEGASGSAGTPGRTPTTVL